MSQNWSADTHPHAEDLLNRIEGTDPAAFAGAVQDEVQQRVRTFAEGVQKLESAERAEPQEPLPCVFEEGTSRLLRAEADGPAVILVPSLINRAYILDLGQSNSLVRSLASAGLDTYLVDWDEPGEQEQSFTIDDYVDRLERMRDHVTGLGGPSPAIVGYCMGGLLALALAARAPDKIARLALLATPWDFSAMPSAGLLHLRNSMPWLSSMIDTFGVLSVDILQAMFAGIDPCATVRKFRQFANMTPGGEAAQAFVQLEDWLNDGVPLAGPVARECLQDWYLDNKTMKGEWSTRGDVVDPGSLPMPALVVVPEHDVIVPPETALPLGELLPNAESRVLSSGHIGMIIGGRARRQLYDPLATWLLDTL